MLSGRRAQAARNDERIMASARAVFIADAGAPIAAVAEHAGVGISALYRRFPSKEELLRRLCADGLAVYVAAVEAALADTGDPWEAFAGFMRRAVDADTHALTASLAGTFTPSADLFEAARRAQELNVRLFERTKGALRDDLVVEDVSAILEQIAAIGGATPQRTRELRRRYLELQLDAVRTAPARAPLPGPPPTWQEQRARWITDA